MQRKENAQYSLETEVTKGFFLSASSYYLSDGDLTAEKAIKRISHVHKIGEKEHIEILLIFS